MSLLSSVSVPSSIQFQRPPSKGSRSRSVSKNADSALRASKDQGGWDKLRGNIQKTLRTFGCRNSPSVPVEEYPRMPGRISNQTKQKQPSVEHVI
jgi:hypothetical protein